jgi:glycosyltransferase involved in cell wall biosynthesis
MKIAVLIKSTTFHKGYGGLETQNKALCEGLVKRGYTIDVYSPKKDVQQTEISENGVNYYFVPCQFRRFRTLANLLGNSWDKKVRQLFQENHKKAPYDLVIGQSSGALPLINHKNQLNLKIMSIMHGSKLGEYRTQLSNIRGGKDLLRNGLDLPHVLNAFFKTQRKFVHGSDKLVAVSTFVKDAIVEETYVSPDKITVINNGVDQTKIPYKSVTEASSNPVKLMFYGRLIIAKGPLFLLKALNEIRKENWVLDIVGDGEDKKLVEQEVKKLKFEDRVTFSGQLKYDEALKKLTEEDVFVFPTLRYEGFPMTIVEASFSGLPIVATDIGGNSDGIVDGATGYLVQPRNLNELSEKLEILINNQKLRLSLGDNARNFAINRFTIEHMLDQYEQVIREVGKATK